MKKWYRNGYFVQEVSFNFALHEFQIIRHAKVIHTITPETIEDMNRIIEALDAGEDVNGWEDGNGQTISIEPAGEEELNCLVSDFVEQARTYALSFEEIPGYDEQTEAEFTRTYNLILIDVISGFSDEIFFHLEEMRDFIKEFHSKSEHWIIDLYSKNQILKEFRLRWARQNAEKWFVESLERRKG